VEIEVNIQDCIGTAAVNGTAALTARDVEGNLLAAKDINISPDRWRHWFCCWLEYLAVADAGQGSVLVSVSLAYELSLRLTNDREMQALNAQYRQQNRPTDVLAFAALEADCPGPTELNALPVYLGDIAISVEMAQRQAKAQGHSLQTELVWLAAHGLLHLLGWDHPDEKCLSAMLHQQVVLLDRIGVPIRME